MHPRAKSAAVWMVETVVSFVVFASTSTAQETTLVSVDSSGAQGNSYSYAGSISVDGRYVAFQSLADNLVPGDTNNHQDVFVLDRQTGTTTRVSVDSAGGESNGDSQMPSLSADGRYVAFVSLATNIGGPPMPWSIFVHDRLSGETSFVSLTSTGATPNSFSAFPSISADGRYVAFASHASNLVPGDTNGGWDIFVHDRSSGTTVLESVSSAGVQGNADSGFQSRPHLSADGRFVVFSSSANNLVAGDASGFEDVFVRDLESGVTTLVSRESNGAQADDASTQASISADGRTVAFESLAHNLCSGDVDGYWDIFVHDRVTGITRCASVSSGGVLGNGDSHSPALSADGRFVAYWSYARNLVAGDRNGVADVFVHDVLTGQTTRASVGPAGVEGNGTSFSAAITSDGRFVTFESASDNLVAGDANRTTDAFLFDRGAEPFFATCFGDGIASACPCGNNGNAGHGCQNSASTGGALLSAVGTASLSADTLSLTASGELPSALSIFLQGSELIAPVTFGDGLRCAGGVLKRLYVHNAIGGVVSGPQGADVSISARSAALGAAIPLGATRHYQVYYRDPDLAYCSAPQGNSWNASHSLSAVWSE